MLKLATGEVSESPYPSRIWTGYFASKAFMISTGIGAPPDMQYWSAEISYSRSNS